jgi:hypothetical protein
MYPPKSIWINMDEKHIAAQIQLVEINYAVAALVKEIYGVT